MWRTAPARTPRSSGTTATGFPLSASPPRNRAPARTSLTRSECRNQAVLRASHLQSSVSDGGEGLMEGEVAGWGVGPAGTDVAVRPHEQCSLLADAAQVHVLLGQGLDV